MGLKLGKIISSNVRGLGRTVKKAAPLIAPVLAATGVGAPLAAAIALGSRAAGGLAAGDKVGRVLKDTAYGGARDVLTGGALKVAKALPGASRVTGMIDTVKEKVGGLIPDSIEGKLGDIQGAVKTARKAAGIGPITPGSVLRTAVGAATGGAGLTGEGALNAANLIAAQDAARKRDRLLGKAVNVAEQDYAARGAYRDAAKAKLLNPTRPDLSETYGSDAYNPYRRVKTARPA